MSLKNNKKILILGGSSFVGRHLFARCGIRQSIATYCNIPIKDGICFNAVTMDLADIIKNPEEISHAVILYGDTDPKTCFLDIKKSKALNVDSIKRVIDRLKNWGIKPIFTSSQFVFDGKKGSYTENDSPSPILIYGSQKVAVEEYLQKTCSDYAILRLPKVVGSELGDGTLFDNWLNDIEKTDTMKCASDQILSPVYVDDAIESIMQIIEKGLNGIFHVASSKPISRIELLRMLLGCVNKYSPAKVTVTPCSIYDFKLSEKRPLDASMVSDKFVKATGIKLTDIKTVCEKITKKKFQKYE